MKEKVECASHIQGYQDPTETLPNCPPPLCLSSCGTCNQCKDLTTWWNYYADTVDDLIVKSNVHSCNIGSSNATFKSCKDNKYGTCKACFPHSVYPHTEIDQESGAINLKKKEAWINSISPAITYLFRCT